MRFFAAPAAVAAVVRQSVMQALGQPNGQANEPWPLNGDFVTGGDVYLALSPRETEGEFWSPLIAAALEAGVEEISEAEYMAARPAPPAD